MATHEHHANAERLNDSSHTADPWQQYAATFAALLVLMGATIGASYIPMGILNIPVALTIAVMKTVLVVWIFMGVRHGTKLTWVWAAIGFIWLFLMFGTLGDYVTRNWIRLPQGW